MGHRAVFLLLSAGGVLGVVTIAVTRFDLVAGALGRSGDLTGRTEIWSSVWRHIGHQPLLGYGWGGVWREASAPTQAIWREARFAAFYAHNGYLDVLLQVGAVGLALFLLVLVPALRTLWRGRASSAYFWALLVIVTNMVAALTESAPFTGRGLLLLLPIAGAVISERRTDPVSSTGKPVAAGAALP